MKTTILSQIDIISFSLIFPLDKLSVFRNAGFSAIGIGLLMYEEQVREASVTVR